MSDLKDRILEYEHEVQNGIRARFETRHPWAVYRDSLFPEEKTREVLRISKEVDVEMEDEVLANLIRDMNKNIFEGIMMTHEDRKRYFDYAAGTELEFELPPGLDLDLDTSSWEIKDDALRRESKQACEYGRCQSSSRRFEEVTKRVDSQPSGDQESNTDVHTSQAIHQESHDAIQSGQNRSDAQPWQCIETRIRVEQLNVDPRENPPCQRHADQPGDARQKRATSTSAGNKKPEIRVRHRQGSKSQR